MKYLTYITILILLIGICTLVTAKYIIRTSLKSGRIAERILSPEEASSITNAKDFSMLNRLIHSLPCILFFDNKEVLCVTSDMYVKYNAYKRYAEEINKSNMSYWETAVKNEVISLAEMNYYEYIVENISNIHWRVAGSVDKSKRIWIANCGSYETITNMPLVKIEFGNMNSKYRVDVASSKIECYDSGLANVNLMLKDYITWPCWTASIAFSYSIEYGCLYATVFTNSSKRGKGRIRVFNVNEQSYYDSKFPRSSELQFAVVFAETKEEILVAVVGDIENAKWIRKDAFAPLEETK